MSWQPTKDYSVMTVEEIGQEMLGVRIEKEAADAISDDLSGHMEFLKKVAMPKALERAGLKNIRFADGQGITTSEELYVSVKSDNSPAFIAWLDEHGEGDLAKRTVNSQSLKSWYKKGLAEGRDLPYDLVTASAQTVAKFLAPTKPHA